MWVKQKVTSHCLFSLLVAFLPPPIRKKSSSVEIEPDYKANILSTEMLMILGAKVNNKLSSLQTSVAEQARNEIKL